ncbi:hypothetical protein Patl1_34814 [Pistacia atlantica]|uniref:Uncharacterized protein n=1 Tax=Pistacia atlantica TaxID=434234 RepID=A0ACC0ZSN1_9ROSI|nr:hypothetical protein Patl1_34814 [Pistacia atlantica]
MFPQGIPLQLASTAFTPFSQLYPIKLYLPYFNGHLTLFGKMGTKFQLFKILVFRVTFFPREYRFNWLVRHSLYSYSSILSSCICHIETASDSSLQDSDLDILPGGFFFGPLIKQWVQSPGFRSGQALMLRKRLYGNIWAHCIDKMEGLNKDFKKMLNEHADFKALSLKDIYTASDGTKKIRTLHYIENLLIDLKRSSFHVIEVERLSLFQVRMGLKRHLTTAEIVEQAVFTQHLPSSEVGSISNVVFMLKRFLHESNCAFAVSLNATTDEVRNWIVSINRKYELGLLLETLREEFRQVKPVVRGRGTAQSSNNPPRPSPWRYPALVSPVFCPSFTANPYLVAHPVQHTTKPQTDFYFRINSSCACSHTTSPDSSFPSQNTDFLYHILDCFDLDCSSSFTLGQGIYTLSCCARSAYRTRPVQPSSNRSAYKNSLIRPSRTPLSQTDLSDLHALAQATKDFPTDHMKQDFDKPPQRSGRECFFCKRDLSFTPEADGPISQPSIPPSVAVLPCGHYFHTRYLEIVNPHEKSIDPLCILCEL